MGKMADASYDVVIVGGSKAIIAGMYLAKYGGMSVALFEEKHELCSGWCTEEGPAPGILANHCSAEHYSSYWTLIKEDFPEWEEYGVKVDDGECYAREQVLQHVYGPRDGVGGLRHDPEARGCHG